MTIAELTKGGTFPPVVLLFGDEELLVEEAASELFNAACASDTAGMSSDVLDADSTSLDAVLSVARSYPMMSDRRTLWVKRFEKISGGKAKSKDSLQSFLSDPPPFTVLILSASVPSASGIGAASAKNQATMQRKIKGLKFPFNLLFSSSAWVEFPSLRTGQRASWVQQRAQKYGLTIDLRICESIVARHGSELRALDTELQKLAAFVGNEHIVTEGDVARIVGHTSTNTVFDLQRAISRRDVPAAITILNELMDSDRQELFIVSMLTRYFTALFKLVDAQALRDSGAIASAIGVPPFAVADHITALQNLGTASVEFALHQLRLIESLCKSSASDPQMLLTGFVVTVLRDPRDTSAKTSLDIFAA